MPPVKNFDDSRIVNNPDKLLLERVRAYFETFIIPSPEGMRSMQAPGYTMTDIPLCVIRTSSDNWYNINSAFVTMARETKVTAISLYGSAAPGAFSVMENLVEFTLIFDPPPEPAKNLPPGAKAGDRCGMIMLTVIWWTATGQVAHELEYGRLTWPGFDINEFGGASSGPLLNEWPPKARM